MSTSMESSDFRVDEHAAKLVWRPPDESNGDFPPDQAVHAGFGAQGAVGVVAFDLDAGRLMAGERRLRILPAVRP